MKKLGGAVIFMFIIGVTTNGLFDLNEVKNQILQSVSNSTNQGLFDLNTLKSKILNNVRMLEVSASKVKILSNKLNVIFVEETNLGMYYLQIGIAANGLFDISDVKNKLLQWKTQKLAAVCPSNANSLMNLLNLVCTTAQPTNVTVRDACYNCFARVTSMPEGPQELSALSLCAIQYFVNTSYAPCAVSVVALSTSNLNNQPTIGCYMGYCDFVRCLRRTNANNLIIQCTREARTGVNINLDADNVRFFTNVTSCILAKARCGTYNPITGAVQTPGYTNTGAQLSNSLQFSAAGELRILAFPVNSKVTSSFCTSSTNLTQTSWLTNVC